MEKISSPATPGGHLKSPPFPYHLHPAPFSTLDPHPLLHWSCVMDDIPLKSPPIYFGLLVPSLISYCSSVFVKYYLAHSKLFKTRDLDCKCRRWVCALCRNEPALIPLPIPPPPTPIPRHTSMLRRKRNRAQNASGTWLVTYLNLQEWILKKVRSEAVEFPFVF